MGSLPEKEGIMFGRKSEEEEEKEVVGIEDAGYAAGLEAGIRKYAWIENRVEYVGARPKTRNAVRLQDALREAGLVSDTDASLDKKEGGDDSESGEERLPRGQEEEARE